MSISLRKPHLLISAGLDPEMGGGGGGGGGGDGGDHPDFDNTNLEC